MWWHLAHGRLMAENHIFPRSDLFSSTLKGTPWVNFEWLSQMVLYLLVKFGGYKTLILAKVFLGLLIFGFLVMFLRTLGSRGPVLFLLSVAGFLILKSRMYERIELVSFLLMPICIWAFCSLRHLPIAIARKIPWVLFGFMVLWCNLHGGFIYGLGAMVLLNIGARWSRLKPDTLRLMDNSVVLMLIAIFINPFGPRLVEVFVEHLIQLGGPQLIEEWAPPTLQQSPVFWGLFIVSLVRLAVGLLRQERSARFWGPLVLAFAVWGAQHQRNTVYLVFAGLPFLAEIGWKRKQWVAWAASLVVAGFMVPLLHQPSIARPLQENRFPIGACAFIKNTGMSGTMYNTYHIGGFIEWELGPAYPVFMDGRYIFQPLLVDHSKLDNELLVNPDGKAWGSYLDSFGVDMAIVEYDRYLITTGHIMSYPLVWSNVVFPRENWALVYWDDSAMVYAKRTQRLKPFIQQYEFQWVWPNNLDQMRAMLQRKEIYLPYLKTELERHQQIVPFSVIRGEIEKVMQEPPPHVV